MLGQVGQGTALPFLVLGRTDVAEYVMFQGGTPLGFDGVAHFLAERRVLDPLQQGGRAAGVNPVGQQGVQHGAGGGVGILVIGNINAGVAARVHQGGHPFPHAGGRVVVMGNMGRHAAALPDVKGLAERVEEAVAQAVAGVGHIKAAQVAKGGANRHQFGGVAVGPGRIGQAGGKAKGAVAHPLAGQFLHSGQFGGRGQAVGPAHRRHPDSGVGNEIDHIAGHAAVQQIQKVLDAAPADTGRRRTIDGRQVGQQFL